MRDPASLMSELGLVSLSNAGPNKRCVTVREMKKVVRGRRSGADLKPPQAAVVKIDGGERRGKVGIRFRQARLREASANERARLWRLRATLGYAPAAK